MAGRYRGFSAYLVFDRHGISRMSRRAPTLKSGEHAIEVTLRVPSDFWRSAIPNVKLDVPSPPRLPSDTSATISPTVQSGGSEVPRNS